MMSNPFYLCEVPTDYYSNQIKSNQIKSNQIKSNQIKSRKGMTWLDLAPTSDFSTNQRTTKLFTQWFKNLGQRLTLRYQE
nr:hypothetical protein [Vibrio sp. G-C-1]